jgi:two-component system CheB/CheR fusion protein
MPVARLFTPEDVQQDAPAAELRTARDEGRAEDNRWQQRKDGSRLFASGVTAPMLGDDGTLQGYAKIARDLTGTRQIEEQREELLREESAARQEAQTAVELKDEFLAVMSHELKNPLNLIQLNAELLSRLPEASSSAAIARAAETIRRTVQGQAQIIDDLLDLSRMNTGKLTLYREPVDWSATIKRIANAAGDDARAHGIALNTDVDEALWIWADPVRVDQVAWNLVSNALKFTPQGGRVTLRLKADGGFGRLDVEDSGRGIAPEFMPQVFQMFQQAETYKTRREGGLGIGLALVRHIVELHGGRVAVASPGVDQGATFSVWLPLRETTSTLEVGGAEAKPLPAGLRVLVVDDDVAACNLLRDLLVAEGATVTAVHSGPQALEAVARGTFDLVACDIAMPDMDGHELAVALRKNERTAALPIVAISGFGRPSDIRRALKAGFDNHLAKPITLEKVRVLFLKALGDRRKPA